ncbi:hypothetical protein LX15_002076 [Streptoalloteichus tenebrarius]|uniref:Transcriptional regulator n=1 Tax=Streptoalloteichus tenebrarius (strain ATCC 17920 / DSM 40477 / JCM 4838 / CBS 697.72 / NBRC 16177 / NCIMB 11028 / NRRL B-12390 / A12253. 1 / ISP 5477) TaxID=1933 RepID=A0ABT1HSA9_STRSD|nr:transcriptional regulator [Streptoalloteichus tenebrarius]MCP2258382.1 hypothetical protein [Streptoalloteichus tenebrarius]
MGEERREPELDELRAWAEQVATYFMRLSGWPPITGRALGWLMVCEPREQSAANIAEAIRASRASLTGTLRMLTLSKLVQAVTRPGERTTYYRIADDAWATVLRQRFAGLAEFLDITRRGRAMFPEGSPRAARVLAAEDVFRWLVEEVEPMFERWDAEHRE